MILRGAKALPLFARVAEAGVPRAVVLPAAHDGRLQARARRLAAALGRIGGGPRRGSTDTFA